MNAKASQFAYPPPTTHEASTQASKVPTAVLSTTNRARQKAKQKEAAKGGSEPSVKNPAQSDGSGGLDASCWPEEEINCQFQP